MISFLRPFGKESDVIIKSISFGEASTMIVNAMMGRLHVRNSDQSGQSGVLGVKWLAFAMKKGPWLFRVGDEILPSYIGIIRMPINQPVFHGVWRADVSTPPSFQHEVLSRQKFSSNVVERCLQLASGEDGTMGISWWMIDG